MGSPFVGKFRRATVFHDVECERRARPWQDVHRMFFDAMIEDGVDEAKAWLMYKAVNDFGPRWDKDGNDLTAEPPTLAFMNTLESEFGGNTI
jgi:hypothetical protein